MLTMYPGMVNSPITELAAAIDDVQTTITVVDGTKLPDAPNLAIIGRGEDAETILYTEKTGNVLSGVVRGFQGVAKAWGQGARIARFFTEYDQRAMMQNIQENADNLAAHLNERATDDVHGLLSDGKIIEEVGSNANGHYVRFADGTQICWREVYFPLTDLQQGYTVLSYPYPAQFDRTFSNPSAFASVSVHSEDLNIQNEVVLHNGPRTDSATSWNQIILNRISTNGNIQTVELNLFAIGRWK